MPHNQEHADLLCADLDRAITALKHQRWELEEATAGKPLSAGLRVTLIALIDQAEDRALALMGFVEKLEKP